jgi:hypothetical protein
MKIPSEVKAPHRVTESPLRDLARQLRATAQAHMAYSQVVELMQVVYMHINALAHIEEMHRQKEKGPGNAEALVT